MTLKEVIENTADYLQDAYEELLQKQLSGENGSVYLDTESPERLDFLLRTSNWEETIHQEADSGCRVFVTRDVPGGHSGLVNIADLPDDSRLTVKKDQDTGKAYLAVENDIGPASRETWAVIEPIKEERDGAEHEIYVLRSIHPGEPGQPTMEVDPSLKEGTTITKTAAIAMGFDKAGISMPEQMKEFVHDMQMRIYDAKRLNENLQSPEICKAIVEREGLQLRHISRQTSDICIAAVKQSPWALQFVKEQTPEINMAAVKRHGSALYFIEDQTPACCAEAVARYGAALEYVHEQTPEICMKAVRSDGLALEYVKEQTPEICLAAVRQTGEALMFVREQTPEICLEAVRSSGLALEFVRNQTPEICMEAVRDNGLALEYVKEQTPEICLAALREDPGAIEFVDEITPEMLEAAEQNIPESPEYVEIEPNQYAMDLLDDMNRIEFEEDGPEFTEIGIERFNDIGDVVRVTEDVSDGIGNLQNDDPDPFER